MAPRSEVTALRTDKAPSSLVPFFLPEPRDQPVRWSQSSLLSREGPSPLPTPPISRVTVLLTSGGFWFIPWREDFIFITARSAGELE